MSKVELSLFAVQDIMPKTMAALTPARCPTRRSASPTTFSAGRQNWPMTEARRPHTDILAPLRTSSPPTPCRPPSSTTRPRKRPITPSRSAADHPRQLLEGHAGGSASKDSDIPTGPGRVTGDFWCDKVRPPPEDRQAHFRHRPADGRRLERLLLQFPVPRRATQKIDDNAGGDRPAEDRVPPPSRRSDDYTDILSDGCTRRRPPAGRTPTTTSPSTTRRR